MGAACSAYSTARATNVEFQANLAHEHKSSHKCTDTYDFVRILGTGKYGSVWLGVHKQTGRNVADKIIEVGHGETWKELKNEASIMKSLRHLNIVQIHEIFATKDTLFSVMAHCSGGDLSVWLNNAVNKRGLTLCDQEHGRQVARIGVKTLSALAYMHDRHICHRWDKLKQKCARHL
jgi:serine/threonine protein kinase